GSGQVRLWDLTILNQALKLVGRQSLPAGVDWIKKLMIIRKLVKARNEDAHSTKCWSHREYSRLFTTIRYALTEIDFDDEEIETIRTAGFTKLD
ncbi:unnamed protein product, partial [Allacma fusca]